MELGSHLLGRDEIIELAKEWDPMPFHIDERPLKSHRMAGSSPAVAI